MSWHGLGSGKGTMFPGCAVLAQRHMTAKNRLRLPSPLPSEDIPVEFPKEKEYLLSIVIASAAIVRKHASFLPLQSIICSPVQPKSF